MSMKKHISDAMLETTLAGFGGRGFSSAAFRGILEASGIAANIAAEATRRFLQRARKSRRVSHDPATGLWTYRGATNSGRRFTSMSWRWTPEEADYVVFNGAVGATDTS